MGTNRKRSCGRSCSYPALPKSGRMNRLKNSCLKKFQKAGTMYRFNYFTENDEHKVIEFIKENYFALITGWDGEYPVATQIPLEIHKKDGQLIFSGHMMRNT